MPLDVKRGRDKLRHSSQAKAAQSSKQIQQLELQSLVPHPSLVTMLRPLFVRVVFVRADLQGTRASMCRLVLISEGQTP